MALIFCIPPQSDCEELFMQFACYFVVWKALLLCLSSLVSVQFPLLAHIEAICLCGGGDVSYIPPTPSPCNFFYGEWGGARDGGEGVYFELIFTVCPSACIQAVFGYF